MFLAKILLNNEPNNLKEGFNNRYGSIDKHFYYQLCDNIILCIINDAAMASSDKLKKWFNSNIAIAFNHEEKILEYIISEINHDFLINFECEMDIIRYEIIPFEDFQFLDKEDFCVVRSLCPYINLRKKVDDPFLEQRFCIDLMHQNNDSKMSILERTRNISSDLIEEFKRIDDDKNTKKVLRYSSNIYYTV